MKRVSALVKPELLVWARENAGFSQEEAAKKIQVTPERLANWEKGDARPTVKQLRKLSGVYKRPLAVFYLSKPPKDFQTMRDFRRLPGEVAGIESPLLRLEIRKARYRREIALRLLADLGEKTPSFGLRARLSDPTEDVAKKARSALGVTYEEQTSWKSPYEALTGWRASIERRGILVFQARGIEVAEMRGFSIAERTKPVIVVNVKDHPHGRIFSMLHELAHLMLHHDGLCVLAEDLPGFPENQRIEVFCNRVAGAVLMPGELLLREDLVRKRPVEHWGDEDLRQLARKYRVSPEAMLRRLLILGKTTESHYREQRQLFYEAQKQRSEKKASGGAPPHRLAITTAGPAFVRLVLESFYQEKITSSDVADYLEVRLKWMPKIEEAIFGRRQDVWALA